jgi:ABC-2 type transport system permease protein
MAMAAVWTVCKRELGSYFATPIAYVFLAIFALLSGLLAFYVGGFFEQGQADLQAFFQFHPWLYLFLIPALAMRLWAEERRGGTIELLLTLPVSLAAVVAGKFLAAWVFTAFALVLTFPLWLTVNYLGSPDNGAILAAYLGSLLMAGAFLAIGACMSALTRNQVIAFVLTGVVGLGFVLAGFPMVLELMGAVLPPGVVETVRGFGFLAHFDALSRGVIEATTVLYFASLIVFWLFVNASIIELRKAD